VKVLTVTTARRMNSCELSLVSRVEGRWVGEHTHPSLEPR
jgi:hypothetical protein